MSSHAYLEHVRSTLRPTTAALQVLAIAAWIVSLLVNPQVHQPIRPATCALLLALVGICLWKGWIASVQWWRVGTMLYGMLLAWAFRMDLTLMDNQRAFFTLPLAILMSVGFAGIIPLRRDYLLVALMIWLILLAGQQQVVPSGTDLATIAVLVTSTILVALGLNHAIIVNLRTTFTLKEDFRHLSETDTLTELPNRRSLIAQLESACSKAAGEEWHFAMLDLDDFKLINDQLGHDVGDEVLMAVASVLRQLPHSVAIGRLGGEEFGLIVRGVSRLSMRAILEQLLDQVRELRIHGTAFSFSAGFVRIQPSDRIIDVLRNADLALYAAKRGGKACIVGPGWEQPA